MNRNAAQRGGDGGGGGGSSPRQGMRAGRVRCGVAARRDGCGEVTTGVRRVDSDLAAGQELVRQPVSDVEHAVQQRARERRCALRRRGGRRAARRRRARRNSAVARPTLGAFLVRLGVLHIRRHRAQLHPPRALHWRCLVLLQGRCLIHSVAQRQAHLAPARVVLRQPRLARVLDAFEVRQRVQPVAPVRTPQHGRVTTRGVRA